jgi:GNAT superfamily N-acetyltransferase
MKDLKQFIKTNVREFLNEQITYKLDGDYINYYINNDKIGYIEYYYDGSNFTDSLSGQKEFYIAMIEVYDDFRGNDYSTKILNHIKDFAKEKSATIITLRVDEGLGFTNRQPNKGLEKLYLKNGFKYLYTEDEVKNDETKNLGAMYFLL